MTKHGGAKDKKDTIHDPTSAEGSDDIDMDRVIACMKEAGHRDPEGRLILPKYYDE